MGRRAPWATDPAQSRGRLIAEPDSPTRSPFQRDRDRIVHSTAFRRLAHKTQVFVHHEGDHYRTRLTHTIEVAQIARALSRTLGLDEDLAEAIALAHDLGHTPFGHTGEDVLDERMAQFGGFDHNAQALRIVTRLEARYATFDGLNLTWETLEGLVKHNGPLTDRFTASVNAGSSTNFTNTFNSSTTNFLTNTFQSNVQWNHLWSGKPYNLAVGLRHSQNTLNKSFDITLPSATFNVQRVFPADWFRGGAPAVTRRWYAASQKSFMPYREPMVFARGERQYLWDEAGRKYIDLLGMNVCISVGHAHPAVNAAVAAQIGQLQHCTTMFSHPVPAHYAEELAARLPNLPGGAEWVVHFTSSGAEAIDLALVMAQAYTRNTDVLALRNAYHGATMGAQSLTGIAAFRHHVPLLPGIHHIANPDTYRGIFGADTAAYLAEIDRTLQYATPGRLAGMLVEPIQGYGGIVELPPGYLKAAAAKVRAAGGILVVDEVQSGFGRTGDHFWGFEAHDVVPEVVVMAKGIGNGFPLGAVVAQRAVADALKGKFLFHTYGASPMACAAGRAVLQVIDDERLQENARTVGCALREVLERLQAKHAIIGDVRGRGLMQAVELVRDRRTKEPATEETAEIFERTREHGLVVSKSGAHRNILRMVPPMCLQRADVDVVEQALQRCFEGF